MERNQVMNIIPKLLSIGLAFGVIGVGYGAAGLPLSKTTGYEDQAVYSILTIPGSHKSATDSQDRCNTYLRQMGSGIKERLFILAHGRGDYCDIAGYVTGTSGLYKYILQERGNLDSAFKILNANMNAIFSTVKNSSADVVTAYMNGNELQIANTGSSHAMLVDKNFDDFSEKIDVLFTTQTQKVKPISSGDWHCLSCQPGITKIQMARDHAFLVLANEAFWKICNAKLVANFVLQAVTAQEATVILGEYVDMLKPDSDVPHAQVSNSDITAMVIDLSKIYQETVATRLPKGKMQGKETCSGVSVCSTPQEQGVVSAAGTAQRIEGTGLSSDVGYQQKEKEVKVIASAKKKRSTYEDGGRLNCINIMLRLARIAENARQRKNQQILHDVATLEKKLEEVSQLTLEMEWGDPACNIFQKIFTYYGEIDSGCSSLEARLSHTYLPFLIGSARMLEYVTSERLRAFLKDALYVRHVECSEDAILEKFK